MKTAFISPLRYPGGKAKLGPYFARILANQNIPVRTYAESMRVVQAPGFTCSRKGMSITFLLMT